jgi:hypothetical protein
VLDYRVNGKRKFVWRSTMADARDAANEAIEKITDGNAEVLKLTSADSHAYVRARAAIEGIEKGIDDVVREYGEAYRLLAGRASILEVSRDWLKRHAVELPRVSVADAVEQLKRQAISDGKSQRRKQQLAAVLDAFAAAFNCEVRVLTPKEIAD